MATLPDITVTEAQYDRLAAVLPGDTPAAKADAYRAATRDFWRRQIIDSDIRAAIEAHDTALEEARAAAVDNTDNL